MADRLFERQRMKSKIHETEQELMVIITEKNTSSIPVRIRKDQLTTKQARILCEIILAEIEKNTWLQEN